MKNILISLFLILMLCVGCTSSTTIEEEMHTTDFFAMDTVMSMTAYGPHAKDALLASMAEVTRLEKLFSTTIASSDLAKLNENKSQKVSSETFELLNTSVQLHEETNGAFNIALFPIVKAWGFTTQTHQIPSDETLSELLLYTDVQDIIFEEASLHVSIAPNMELGLGGIVKGYTSERILHIFKEHGVTSGIVNLGGNVQVLGKKPDASLWNVAIKNPLDTSSHLGFVSTYDKAIITSGAYERNFEANGIIYHHLMDPTTGKPAENSLASVTILAEDGTRTDALTKLFVSGLDDAIAYCKKHKDEVDAILVTKDKKVYITANLENSFTLQAEDYSIEIIH